MKVKLIRYTPNPEALVTSSAKLCYSSVGIDEIEQDLTSSNIQKFLDNLIKIGHESPLEHIAFTFAIEGVSRVLSHQLVRHRIASHSQQSQRYVKENQFEYIIPERIKNSKKATEIFIKNMEEDQKVYDEIVDILIEELCYDYLVNDLKIFEFDLPQDKALRIVGEREEGKRLLKKYEKIAIENARYVLPNACETKLVLTMNARSLLNFFNLRSCNRAQDEIRELSDKMLIECKKVAPIIFSKAGPECVRTKCSEGSMSCGKPRLDLLRN